MASASGVVGPLAPSARTRHRSRPAFSGDHPLQRGGHQDVAALLQQCGAVDGTLGAEPGQHAVRGDVRLDRVQRQPRRVEQGGGVVADAGDGHAEPPGQGVGGHAADVAEHLGRSPCCRWWQADRLARPVHQVRDAPPGRLPPPLGAAERHGLAGDDLADRVALVHGVGVHEPRHHLLVGAHVRRHDVRLRTDERDHLLHVAAGHRLQLAPGQGGRIAGDAALGPAIRQPGQGALPAHPDRQRRHLPDVELGGEARAALGGAERQVVLDAVALEHLRPAIVHVDGDGHGDRPLRVKQAIAFVVRDFQVVGDDGELGPGHVEDRPGVDGHAAYSATTTPFAVSEWNSPMKL